MFERMNNGHKSESVCLKKERESLVNARVSQANLMDSQENLIGFFDLLLKIDMRINPSLYSSKDHYD